MHNVQFRIMGLRQRGPQSNDAAIDGLGLGITVVIADGGENSGAWGRLLRPQDPDGARTIAHQACAQVAEEDVLQTGAALGAEDYEVVGLFGNPSNNFLIRAIRGDSCLDLRDTLLDDPGHDTPQLLMRFLARSAHADVPQKRKPGILRVGDRDRLLEDGFAAHGPVVDRQNIPKACHLSLLRNPGCQTRRCLFGARISTGAQSARDSPQPREGQLTSQMSQKFFVYQGVMYQLLSNRRFDTICDTFLMSFAYPVHIFEDMTKSAHILVVDDHQEIRHLVGRVLEKDGYRVSTAADGRQMRQRLRDHVIDLIVLDLMLPVEDGLALCRDLRAKSSPIPIIILTAKGDEIDRVLGLEMGADDYVAKPFSSRELLARIKAVLRRSHAFPPQGRNADPTQYRFGDWSLDTTRRELENDDIVVPLSSGEFNLLMAFLRHPKRVLNRDQLLDLAKGRSAAPLDRSIDLQVSRLRRKIEKDAKNPEIIKTVWGDGYIFTLETKNE